MGERLFTTIECPECHTVLAKRDPEGVIYLGSVPVVASLVICPECHSEVPISQFAINGNSLEFSTAAISEIVKTLALINGNGGFGELKIRFQKYKARWVGMESSRDCQ